MFYDDINSPGVKKTWIKYKYKYRQEKLWRVNKRTLINTNTTRRIIHTVQNTDKNKLI